MLMALLQMLWVQALRAHLGMVVLGSVHVCSKNNGRGLLGEWQCVATHLCRGGAPNGVELVTRVENSSVQDGFLHVGVGSWVMC